MAFQLSRLRRGSASENTKGGADGQDGPDYASASGTAERPALTGGREGGVLQQDAGRAQVPPASAGARLTGSLPGGGVHADANAFCEEREQRLGKAGRRRQWGGGREEGPAGCRGL